ncbi:MAG TPA: long-chain-acyl-CoA synthetase [Xanthobacteraceae bacterium]|nr:long-chain-acyl-CoA synthetase [Xanthobacteraceae bacterium]
MGLIERLKGDVVTLKGALRTLKMTTPIAKNPSRVFPDVIDDLAAKFGDAPALMSDRESLSYRALAERSNRYARWALTQGLTKGDTICLLMPNRPEFMAIWLGVTRAGGVVALVNTNLAGAALAHCINVVEPKHVIVAAELAAGFAAVRPHLATNAKVWLHGEGGDLPRLDRAVEGLAGEALEAGERRALTIEDRALYIYTSGTTGMPKAANINHYRLMLATHGFAGIMDTRATDRIYDCLPMYHTVGGVVATGAALIAGGSVAIREKFSAREFWDDIARWDCTVFQYIGELCRYLVNSPPHPREATHRLRLACGNGLRPDVWGEFQKRFRIPQILEFYAATEGNVSMFNFEGKPGAVGRIPWFLAHRFPTKLVKFDIEAEQPVRNAEGLCVACAPNEVGEAVGKILKDPSRPGSRFEGYASEAETEKKILHDVFEKGDAWFRTGDLMRQDEQGYFYFVDRIGDTFRWKGENVATSQVSETITVFPGVKQANAYGVAVAGREGRAGMAALVVEPGFDLAAFRAYLGAHLPDYARPLFLRLLPELDVTATFKQKKFDLVREGFDPSRIADPLYFSDAETRAFVRLDPALYDRIQSGAVRM